MKLSAKIRNAILLLLSVAACFQFSLLAVPAHAQTTYDPTRLLEGTGLGGGASAEQSAASLPIVIGRFIAIALSFLGIIFLVLIIYAGFLWMTAAGEEKKVEQAKNILKQAIIGIIILFLAYSLSAFIVGAVSSATQP